MLNLFFSREGCSTICLCQYSLDNWPSRCLLEVLTTHPLALINNTLFHNLYYIPLEEFFAFDLATAQLNRWMINLKVSHPLIAAPFCL